MQVRNMWPHVSPPCHESIVVTQLRCDDSLSRSDALKRHQRNGGCRPRRAAEMYSRSSPTSTTSGASTLSPDEQSAAGTSSSATPPLGADNFGDLTVPSNVNPLPTALQMNLQMNCPAPPRLMAHNPQLFSYPVANDFLAPQENVLPNSQFAMPQEGPAAWFPNPVQSDNRRFGQSSMPIPMRHDNYFLPPTAAATVPSEFGFPVLSRHDATTNFPAREFYAIAPRSGLYPVGTTPIHPVYANGQATYGYNYQAGQQLSPDEYPRYPPAIHFNPHAPFSFGNPLGSGHPVPPTGPSPDPQSSQPYRGH